MSYAIDGRSGFWSCLMAACLVVASGPGWAAAVWVEGESATASTMSRHPWWYDQVDATELSGGAWMSHFNQDSPGEASYDVELPAAGRYTLYARVNPVKSRLMYRFDEGDWSAVPMSRATDRRNIAADGAPDLRFIGWVEVGSFELERGVHRLTFRAESESQHHGAIDCFVFTTEAFEPIGTSRPGDVAERATAEGAWAFNPPRDSFGDDALLDLSDMNEDVAGQTGFIGLSDDGMGFVRGDGEPIRFWSVVSYGYRLEPEDMEHHVRMLAKLGVNMVRVHGQIGGHRESTSIDDVNERAIARIHRFIKACKDQGIYLTISPYWYFHHMPESWAEALPGWEPGDMPTGSLFFNERFQRAYKTWTRELLTTVNPHTGLAIKDDPSVAILQVKNEDSLLFYTANRLPREQQTILSRRFARWLVERYGSLDAALEAWDGVRFRNGSNRVVAGLGDAPGDGVVAMLGPWELTQPRQGGLHRRIADQLEFTAEVQRGFYAEIDRYFREELGCRQLTNAMNWKSADKLTLDDVERWTYTANDVVAVNRYAGGRHEGENNGYRIDPGHTIVNRSLLRHPLELPTNLKQVAGHPMVITESTWVRPNLYQSEGPMLTAAYLSLTGVDSLYWFAEGEADWLRDPRRPWWHVVPESERGYALEKWSAALPMLQGMFPANALLFRRGYVAEGEAVVKESRSLAELWRRERPIIAETETFDPNRDLVDRRGQADADTAYVSRLAFLVGRVQVAFGDTASADEVADLGPYIDRQASVVRSNTGELALDWDDGVFTMDAPKAQGVAGFLAESGGRFVLGDVTVESSNEYAAVQVVAMDDRPIAESRRLLVQVGTTNRLTGWTTTVIEDGPEPKRRIELTGEPPYLVKDTDVRLSIGNGSLSKATRLDANGYAAEDVAVRREGGRATLTLPANTMYLVIE